MELLFPLKGIHKGTPASKQAPHTSPRMLNVRPRETLSGRLRGGQRPGLVKWGEGTQIGDAAQPVVFMLSVASVR